MAKIKLTKGELKKQRDSLKQFNRYLPTLQLKKQQLQMKIREAEVELEELERRAKDQEVLIRQWIGLLAEKSINIIPWVSPTDVDISTTNIAGACVPVFAGIHFDEPKYDLYVTPFWLDGAIRQLRSLVQNIVEVVIARKRVFVLRKELRTTTQRVNLFEKVKIPECKDNIRQIRIYLGDQQANAVGVSKVAKKKVEQRVVAV